jgi:hypothetical protein
VFANIVNDTDLGNAKALCVVRAPFQEADNPSLDADIEVLQAFGPSGEPAKSTSFTVHFYQAPVVALGVAQYASGQKFGSFIVQLTHIDGILKVCWHVGAHSWFCPVVMHCESWKSACGSTYMFCPSLV